MITSQITSVIIINRCSSHRDDGSPLRHNDDSLDIIPVELQQQQHYNNNYYYYYNYNLSYVPEDCAPGGSRRPSRLQQLKRRTQHELQQWPMLMQLLLLVLWLNARFWRIVDEQVTYRRRRWH
ncbi:GL26251 [Drosophila persimilis]|uniref:GL26251 n=1 Tax=Drosophila persimilis TaxID=7234 RepID=B4GJA9_DROPE|nr:GL26251 [Drosophila persimilis]